MKLKCIIIEDEPLAYSKLEGFVKQVPFLDLVSGFENAMDALVFLKENYIDIVFLDIQMEKLTGIQMLETMQVKPYIIITSAYAQYALKGYELQVFDYLLKPFSFDRLLIAANKVYDDVLQKQKSSETVSQIFVKSEYKIECIVIDNISYIEGMQGYIRIVLKDRKIMTKMSIKSILGQLPQNKFIQVHKSWIINLSKIETIERNRVRISNKIIPIGDTYKDKFYQTINI